MVLSLCLDLQCEMSHTLYLCIENVANVTENGKYYDAVKGHSKKVKVKVTLSFIIIIIYNISETKALRLVNILLYPS